MDRSMAAALPLTTPCLLPKSFTIDFGHQHHNNLIISQIQLARRTGAFASHSRYIARQLGIKLFVKHTRWMTINWYLPSDTVTPLLLFSSSSDTTLEAFRHNPTDVASYHCSLEQVLSHRSVPAVPLVLRRNAVGTTIVISRVKLTCLTTV